MKNKLFKIFSIIFLLSMVIFYGYRLVYYYRLERKKDNLDNGESILLVTKIKNDLYSSSNISYDNDDIYITGNYKNNYIYYSGRLFRIMKITKNDNIVMVSQDTDVLLPTSTNYKDSDALNYLNDINSNYYKSLESKEAYLEKTTSCVDIITDSSNIICNKKTELLISFISLYDYQKVGSKNSYLNNNTNFNTISTNNENVYYITSSGDISTNLYDKSYASRAVLTLIKEVYYKKGDGSIENPYIIGEIKSDVLNQKNTGEYVKFNDDVWRIISQTDEGTKLASTTVLKDTSAFDNKTNIYSTDTTIYKYLNTTYYESITNKDYLVEGYFYTGAYTDTYTSIYSNKMLSKVGLMNITDLFITDIENYLLINSSNNNKMVLTLNSDQTLYSKYINTQFNIRPVIYLNPNLKTISGTGSFKNPYILGGQ